MGTNASGETTLARSLSRTLGALHVELDALFWGPAWTQTPDDELRSRVGAAVAEDRWVSDGNYSRVRDLVWGRATTLIWLDYGFWTVFLRALRRTILRAIRREEFYSGNRESIRAMADPDWIPW